MKSFLPRVFFIFFFILYLGVGNSYAQTTNVNVSISDESTGGEAPFRFNVYVTILNYPISGNGQTLGSSSDPIFVSTDFPLYGLPAEWSAYVYKLDKYDQVVGIGYDYGSISQNGQIVEVTVVNP